MKAVKTAKDVGKKSGAARFLPNSTLKRITPVMAVVAISFAAVGVYLLSPSNAASVPARQADSLIESMGVAVHLRYWNQGVFDGTFKPRLCELGIRYIRDGGRDAQFFKNLNTLHSECGIKSTLVMDSRDGNTPSNAVSGGILPAIDAITAVEGPNEWDLGGGNGYNGQNFPENVRSYQNALYDAVKGSSDPRVRAITVATPSMANPSAGNTVGPVKCDVGNMHSYNGSPNLPDDQLLTKWIPPTLKMCPGKPIIVTETGYCNTSGGCSGQGAVSERTFAKYAPRHWLENYRLDIQRDHLYNLSLDTWSSFLRSDGTPRPAFYSSKAFISLMKDPGPAFTPGSLGYSITGDQTALRHMLFQKRDGRFMLLVWLNVLSTPGGHNNLNDKDTARPATLNLDSAANGKMYLPSFDGTTVKETFTNASSIPLTVRDQVLIVEIGGGATPTPTPTPNPTPTPTPTPNPGGPADLVVASITSSPATPKPGDQVTFSAVIKNQGGTATPDGIIHGVSFTVDGNDSIKTFSDTNTATLAPGASRTVTANSGAGGTPTWTPSTTGTFTVEAHVDDINRIPESDETNNTLTKSITVGTTSTPKPGDISGPTAGTPDGKTDLRDLSYLLINWGSTAATPAKGDISGPTPGTPDGRIDLRDMSYLLVHWG